MASATRIEVPARLAVVATLAALLERLDRTGGPVHPDQYRSVVQRLAAELHSLAQDPGLGDLLKLFPAASELYENLQYAHAGLCRSPLDASLAAEIAARDVLRRVAR